jgi:hypothetical protein
MTGKREKKLTELYIDAAQVVKTERFSGKTRQTCRLQFSLFFGSLSHRGKLEGIFGKLSIECMKHKQVH